MAGNVQQNLMWAEEAVDYVGKHLRGRACNRPEDILHTMCQAWGTSTVVDLMRDRPDVYNRAFGEWTMHVWQQIQACRRTYGRMLPDANVIIQNRLGNCHEHAVLACDYLAKKGIPSSIYFVTTDDPEYLDHVWVMLGLPDDFVPPLPGVFGNTERVPLDETPAVFGPSAVVCDPWYHEWFSTQRDWARKMRSILRVTTHQKADPLPDEASFTFVDFVAAKADGY
jgi:hypothetical protein